jgi:basic membrane protein A
MARAERGVRRITTICASLLLAALVSAGCGSSDNNSSSGASTSPGTAQKEVKVGLALIGPKNDRAFSQAHYEGVLTALKGLTPPGQLTATVENSFDPQGEVDAFRNMAPRNNLVIGGASLFVNAAQAVAPAFPKTRFIVVPSYTDKLYPNVTSLVPEPGLASFLAGAVMAKLTKTKTLGWIGGGEVPPTEQSLAGITAGAKYVDPSVKVLHSITGDFNDPAKAKPAAAAMVSQGADQLFGYLDAGEQGLYQAAKGKKIGVYQIITLRCGDDPNVTGSMIMDADELMKEAIPAFAAGTLKPGAIFYTLKSPKVLRFDLCPNVPGKPALDKFVQDLTAKVISGEVKVPSAARVPRTSYAHIEK